MNPLTTVRPCLTEFQESGVLGLADVHTAAQVWRLGGEANSQVMLALAVRALRHGSVCVELDRIGELGGDEDSSGAAALASPDPREWVAALRSSPLVAGAAAAHRRRSRRGRVDRDRRGRAGHRQDVHRGADPGAAVPAGRSAAAAMRAIQMARLDGPQAQRSSRSMSRTTTVRSSSTCTPRAWPSPTRCSHAGSISTSRRCRTRRARRSRGWCAARPPTHTSPLVTASVV